jgi:hypothetical protein
MSSAYVGEIRPESRYKPSTLCVQLESKLVNQCDIPILKWENEAVNSWLQPDCWKASMFNPKQE